LGAVATAKSTKVGFFSFSILIGFLAQIKFAGLYKDVANRHFAIKVIDLEKISAEVKQNFLQREMAVWRMMDHAGLEFKGCEIELEIGIDEDKFSGMEFSEAI